MKIDRSFSPEKKFRPNLVDYDYFGFSVERYWDLNIIGQDLFSKNVKRTDLF